MKSKSAVEVWRVPTFGPALLEIAVLPTTCLVARGARANVTLMPNRVNLPPFIKRLHPKRNLVQRFFNKLQHFRAIATRCDKRDLASIKLAFNESSIA
jgi:transposase